MDTLKKRELARKKIGTEFVLKRDSVLGGMFGDKVAIPKGAKVKVIEYHWAYGYKIQDEKGRTNNVWELDL